MDSLSLFKEHAFWKINILTMKYFHIQHSKLSHQFVHLGGIQKEQLTEELSFHKNKVGVWGM